MREQGSSSLRARVFVSRRVPASVRAELESSFAIGLHDYETTPDRENLLSSVAGCEGVVTMLTDTVDAELLDAAGPNLRVVANYAVGVDNVDIAAATRRGVVVANTPDVLTEATAEFTIALLLGLARRVVEGDRRVRSQSPSEWAPTFMLGAGLAGRTLGVVGLGRIGTAVARLAVALGMQVVYTSRREKPDSPYERLELDELLRAADVVTLHVPLTDATRHLVDRAALAVMPSHALLVNTARGPIVDEDALVDALRSGAIAGAALDVFEREPAVHPGLFAVDDVVLSPHLGSATVEAREAMGMLCVDALRAVLVERRTPPNALNPEALAGS